MGALKNNKKITFQEIMAFTSDNMTIFNHISDLINEDSNILIPFVGAGLSIPIYPGWGQSLTLIANKIVNPKARNNIIQLINNSDFYTAAQELENIRTSTNLCKDFIELYSPQKLRNNIKSIRKMAVWLLPLLFKGIAVTTNLDRMLEFVYNECGNSFINELLPGERPGLRKELLSDPHAHYIDKIHGTIEKDARADYTKIVFTESAYNHHYAPGSDVVIDLQETYHKKKLLFLGCSLEKDRTLDILHDVLHLGMENYAIVNCKKEDIDEKICNLGKLGIRAILYPDGEYDSVRILLEALLERKNPDTYRQLQYHINFTSQTTTQEQYNSRFEYDSSLYETVGREEELSELLAFINDDSRFLWWAITGPGGSGKSRLGLNLADNLPSGWTYIHHDLTKDTLSIPIPTTNTLYIIDSAQAQINALSDYINKSAYDKSTFKTRILIIERNDGDWNDRLRKRLLHNTLAMDALFKGEKGYLEINPLGDEYILQLINNYASAIISLSEKPICWHGEKDSNQLLSALKHIDPQLQRPLYALFLTDSYISRDNPSIQTNRLALLETLLEKEKARIEKQLDITIQKPYHDSITRSLHSLLCIATVYGSATQDLLQSHVPTAYSDLNVVAQSIGLDSTIALMSRLGLGDNKNVKAIKPDIMGEYFALRYIHDANQELKQLLLFEKSDNQNSIRWFWMQVLSDFADTMKEAPEYWRWILLDKSKLPSKYFLIYAKFLLIAISHSTNTQLSTSMLELFKTIVTKNRLRKKLVKNCIHSLMETYDIARIENLKKVYPCDSDIATDFALGFSHHKYPASESELEQATDRVKCLLKQFPQNIDIATQYASILEQLFRIQNTEAQNITIEQLSAIQKRYPKNQAIAEGYSHCLCELAISQESDTAEATISIIKNLAFIFPRNKRILSSYAKGLYELSLKQSIDKATSTILLLRNLFKSHPKHYSIVHFYAHGLLILTSRQTSSETTATLKHLKELYKPYNVNTLYRTFIHICQTIYQIIAIILSILYIISIIIVYPLICLLIISFQKIETFIPSRLVDIYGSKNPLSNIYGTLETLMLPSHVLSTLNNVYIENHLYTRQRIFALYIKGLLILSIRQDSKKAIETIKRIATLTKKWHDWVDMDQLYAISLFTYFCWHNCPKSNQAIDMLISFLESKQHGLSASFCEWLVVRYTLIQNINNSISIDTIDSYLMVYTSYYHIDYKELITILEKTLLIKQTNHTKSDISLATSEKNIYDATHQLNRLKDLLHAYPGIVPSIIDSLSKLSRRGIIDSITSFKWIMDSKIYQYNEEAAEHLVTILNEEKKERNTQENSVIFDWIATIHNFYPKIQI